MDALVLFLPSSLLQVFQRRSFSWCSNLFLLYNACFRDHFSSDVCKNVKNGVLFFQWLLLLVLVGKVGWNNCEQPSPSNPKCGRHVFTHVYISLWSFSQQLDFLICVERCLLIPSSAPWCFIVWPLSLQILKAPDS